MKQEVIGTFDRAASLYDQVGAHRFTYFGQLLIDELNISPSAQVLDLATGRGALLFAAAEKVGATGRVIGIDLAPQMVALTQAEIERRGLTQASALVMDADDTPFAPESFDFITCGFALHFLDFERLLPKLRALLKPGGIFAASIPQTPRRDEELARWQWLFDLTRAVFPPGFTPPAAWIAPRLLSKPELAEAALTQAGFAEVRTKQHEGMLYFRDENDWWDWEWSQGSLALLARRHVARRLSALRARSEGTPARDANAARHPNVGRCAVRFRTQVGRRLTSSLPTAP